jgi:hypothetical protein
LFRLHSLTTGLLGPVGRGLRRLADWSRFVAIAVLSRGLDHATLAACAARPGASCDTGLLAAFIA